MNKSEQIKRKNELYNKLNNKALGLKLAVATLNIKVKEKEKEIAYFAIQELKKVKSYFIEECEDEDGFKTGYITLKKIYLKLLIILMKE